jgi:kinesin family protein 18/19
MTWQAISARRYTAVFAYGATGSGKTHTMVGDQTDPGLMVLSLRDVFRFIEKDSEHKDYIVECSYTEAGAYTRPLSGST